MHIKLTEYIRATTLTLNIKDAPMTALPLIKDAFAKLATDLEELYDERYSVAVDKVFAQTAGDVMQPVGADPVAATVNLAAEVFVAEPAAEPKRRGRPPKSKVDEPAPEPTPLEQAVAEVVGVEDEQSQGEIGNSAEPATTESTPTTTSVNTAATPVSDSDLQKYCVKLAQHYGGPQKVFDLAKQFVEEGAVPRPSNIKGDDKRWQFIKAVEEDSNVRYHG
jgi:hypothetical protein